MPDVTVSALIYNLTFDHLATLKAIVECGSFKGAADKLLMTQPAISQRVKHMEIVLGMPLFDRQRGTSATLTPFGERMLALTDHVLNDLKQFHQELNRVTRPTAGEVVSVAAGPSYMKYRLLAVVQSFSDEYPKVELRMRHSHSLDDVLLAVVEGDAHLGIYPANPPARKVQSFPLNREKLVLVVPPDHPILQIPAEARLNALARVPIAVSSSTANSRQMLEAWAAQHDVRLRISIEADNLDTLKEAAIQGMALTFVPSFAVEDELADGRLSTVNAPGLPLKRRVWIVIDGRALPPTTVRRFADYLIAYIHEHYETV